MRASDGPTSFATAALAESERASLLAAARRGEAFDVETGLPVSKLPPPPVVEHPWWDWAQTYTDLKWPTLAPNSRQSTAEALTTVTMALLTGEQDQPSAVELRRVMMQWAFITPRRTAGGPPPDLAWAVAWFARNTVDVRDLADPVLTRSVLDALARKFDGAPAAATTTARKRAVFFNALELAVECGLLLVNPLPQIKWRAPKQAEAIDPACVINPEQARALLAAVAEVGAGLGDERRRKGMRKPVKRLREPKGAPLVAFFGCLYYAGMRPGEVIALVETDLDLPEREGEWGWLRLSTNDPEVTNRWTDTGRRDRRQLKHRAKGEVRPVPCSPELAALLRQHLDTYGVGRDGRLFRGVQGAPIKEGVYNLVWQAARRRALTPSQVASPLAARPYDLRHSCVSTWLAAGVDSAKIAAWVGHSVAVLHRVYAHVLPDRDDVARRRIEDMFDGYLMTRKVAEADAG